MTSLNIVVSIRSSTGDQDYTTTGQIDENVLRFIDPAGEIHTLTVADETLHYHKKGDTTMDFHFQSNVSTEGTYQAMGQTFVFTIRTLHYEFDESGLRLNYQLYQNNDRIGHTVLSIDYTLKEE